MADRTITWNIKANVAGAINGMKSLGDATKRAADNALDWADQNEQSINTLSRGFGLAGAAMTGFAVLAVKKFADFDQAMSNVASTGEDARGSIDSLREAAIQAGADTAFSATEAAGAIEELAKAGLSADEILSGGLAGSLDLAAAGSLDVADAAGYTVTALTQFGLKGSDAAHVADLLAAGAGKAMGDVSDFGQALNQAGLVASQTGLSIEETTGTLAAFAQAGLLGSDAGTSFKTMLQRLSAPSGEAAELMKELGINAYDASGQFVGMEAFAGQLTRALGDMTPAQRNAALSVLFGADAVRAAAVIYSEGESGIRDWISAVDDQGYAAETARVKMDNLKGDLEALGGSIETALIQSGSGANDILRGIVQGADAVVDSLGKIPDSVMGTTSLIAGAGGMAALSVAGLGKMVTSIAEARSAFETLGIKARTAGIAAGAIGGAFAVGTIALAAWADSAAAAKATTDALASSLDATTGAVTRNTREVVANELTTQQGWWLFKKESGADAARTLGVSIDTVTDAILGNKDALREVDDATKGWDGSTQNLIDAAKSAGVEADDYAAAQRTLREEVDRLTGRMGEAEQQHEDVATATGEGADAQDGLKAATEGGTGAIENQVDALQELIEAQQEAAGVVLTERDAQRQFEQAITDANTKLSENGATLDITTQKGRDNQAALDDIATSTWGVIAAMQRNGADQATLQGVMQTSRDRFLGVATAMGMGADEANALADELGLIPTDIKPSVQVQTGDSVSKANAVKDAINAIPSWKGVTVQTNYVETMSTQATRSIFTQPPRTGLGGEFAEGGPVIGPGTGTSDSIHALLSNGEHVLTADEVAAMGGHGAVARWRKAAKAGALPAFASGGAVLAPSIAYSSSAPAALSSQQLDVSAAAYFTDAQVAVLAQAVRESSRATAASAIRTAQARKAVR